MTRLKYDYEMLSNICNDASVTLLNDYKNEYITRDTRIIGKCILCENSFNKSLNKLHKQRNFGCKSCAKILQFERIKNTMIEKYGVEYPSQLQIFRDKMKNTTLERFGVEYATQCEEIKNKTKQTNLATYGVEYGLQTKEVKEKRVKTNLEKYGFENQLQRKEIKDKIKETNFKKYGVECPFQNQEIKDKIKESNLEKYEVEHFTQTNNMKEKSKQTIFEKYGVEFTLQRPEIMEKIKKTNLERYGVEFVTQNEVIMDKMTKSGYKSKEYKYPCGKIIFIQGYEHYALDELINNEKIIESDIITGCKNVPTVWYIDVSSKKRRHFVDIFIPSQNRCIEVKSTWTAKKNEETIFLKQKAAKKLGYLYEIWVYDNKGNKVEFYN